jgi:hypothetical protein
MTDKKPPYFSDEELKIPDTTLLKGAGSTEVQGNPLIPYILATLVIILVFILIGLYYWQQLIENTITVDALSDRPTAAENQEPESDTARAQTQATETMSTSDELNAIEADLESTNLDSLDTDLNAIVSEVESAETQ